MDFNISKIQIGSRIVSKHLAFNFWMPRSFLSEKNVYPFLSIPWAPSQWLSPLLFWLSNQEMDFISFRLRGEAVPEVTPKVIQIFHPRAGKCCMGSHKEKEKKREKRWNQALMSSSARPASWKGASAGKAAAALGFTVSLECTSIQPSLHLVKGLAFDDSAACRLPGEIWPTVWKTLSAPDHTCFYSLPVVRGPFWNETPQEIRPKLWGV